MKKTIKKILIASAIIIIAIFTFKIAFTVQVWSGTDDIKAYNIAGTDTTGGFIGMELFITPNGTAYLYKKNISYNNVELIYVKLRGEYVNKLFGNIFMKDITGMIYWPMICEDGETPIKMNVEILKHKIITYDENFQNIISIEDKTDDVGDTDSSMFIFSDSYLILDNTRLEKMNDFDKDYNYAVDMIDQY